MCRLSNDAQEFEERQQRASNRSLLSVRRTEGHKQDYQLCKSRIGRKEGHFPPGTIQLWSIYNKLKNYLYGQKCSVLTGNNSVIYVLTTAKLYANGLLHDGIWPIHLTGTCTLLSRGICTFISCLKWTFRQNLKLWMVYSFVRYSTQIMYFKQLCIFVFYFFFGYPV